MIDAAVLLIIHNSQIIFIKRTENLKQHSGEVSFPGGKFDPELDRNFLDTAIREVEEEIGLKKNYYEIIDKLPVQNTVSSNFLVHTYVAKTLKKEVSLKINKSEVKRVILIPINHFFNSKIKAKVPLKINGKLYFNTFYYYKEYLIWGATSRILDTFLQKISDD
jgi:8-oxo-dGTP pyrophosphatase MutT (NUDIX family)